MKTSNFKNIKNLKTFASISLYSPSWYVGAEFKTLAPTKDLLLDFHNGLSKEDYELRFQLEVLSKLNAKDVFEKITKQCGNDVVLLCYENPGDFCHRRLVANWLESELFILVPEWQPPKLKTSLIF